MRWKILNQSLECWELEKLLYKLGLSQLVA